MVRQISAASVVLYILAQWSWFLAAWVGISVSALAQDTSQTKNWSLDATITNRYDWFDVTGDLSQSPHSNLGSHHYHQLDLTGRYQISRYENVNASIAAVFNRSRNRSRYFDELIVERANVEWTKGDAAIPFRAAGGDYFGNLSMRTLQRSIKGAQLELQPQAANSRINQSFLVFSGVTDSVYRAIDPLDEIFSGASYLISTPLGDLSVNGVHNYRQANNALNGLPQMQQVVASVAGETSFNLMRQALNLEFEVSGFYGDNGTNAAALQPDRRDVGVFAELTGRGQSIPVNYGFLYERYGVDFRPRGGAISPNRESMEARVGYRFDTGLSARARLKRYVDQLESVNPTTTLTFGGDMSGPLSPFSWPHTPINGTVSGYVSDVASRDYATHRRIYNGNASLSYQIDNDLVVSGGGSYMLTDNFGDNAASSNASGYAGIDWTTALGNIDIHIGPRMTVRGNWSAPSNTYQYVPSLAFDAHYGNHSFSANYGFFFQDARAPSLADTGRHQASARYAYNNGPHSFGVEGAYNGRSTSPGTKTEAFHVGAFYTINAQLPRQAAEQSGRSAPTPAFDPSEIRLADLAPGTRLTQATTRLAEAGITGGIRRGRFILYNVVWVDDLFTRQRLVIEHDGARIIRSIILIDFEDLTRPSDAQLFFNDVRDAFIRRYGTPQSYDIGDFKPGFVDAIHTDKLIRNTDWLLPAGTLRLGIPNRLDRRTQIEIHYAPTFPNIQNTRWGIREIR